MMNTCTHCGFTFSRRWNLARHINHSHSKLTSAQTGDGSPYSGFEQGGKRKLDPYNVEYSQAGGQQYQGVKRKIDSEEAMSDEESNDGSEMSVQRAADTRNEPDIFRGSPAENDEDAYISSSNNSSSDESDACDSSTDYSSDADDEASGGDAFHREDDSVDRIHTNYARWRAPENGVYSLWRSRSQKPYVVRHRDWLKSLLNCKLRRSLIRNSTDSQLEAIREVAMNVLRGGAVMHIKKFDFVSENRAMILLIASERITYSQLRRSLLMPEQVHVLPLLLLSAIPTCLKSRKTVCEPDCDSDELDEPEEN